MKLTTIKIPSGYDLSSQREIGRMMGMLDDQLAQVIRKVRAMEPGEFQWQVRPGTNTAGMLFAHMAVAECLWVSVIGCDQPVDTDGDHDTVLEILGIRTEDDGMPQAPDGGHPASLAGRTGDDYVGLLEKARKATHRVVQGWHDSDLEAEHKTRRRMVTKRWILYHVFEHTTAHFGQVLMLGQLMKMVREPNE